MAYVALHLRSFSLIGKRHLRVQGLTILCKVMIDAMATSASVLTSPFDQECLKDSAVVSPVWRSSDLLAEAALVPLSAKIDTTQVNISD